MASVSAQQGAHGQHRSPRKSRWPENSMFNLIKKLFGSTETTKTKSTFRPYLENLEMREVPSASSGSMHAVSPNPAHPYEQNDFYINAQSHLLYVNSVAITGAKGDPVGIKSLSAGHDANGFADVFATDQSGNLWKFIEGSWMKIKGLHQNLWMIL
jgi:hypothetical protein